jgi:DNA-binding CsgD family transcriptional regulator
MLDLNELKWRLPDLDLHPIQERIADLLLDGCNIERIAVLLKRSERLVNLHVAAIDQALRRPPPDAAVTVSAPKSPRPSPLKAANDINITR